MRKPCPHNILLPRGITCDRGYLFVRVKPDGQWLLRGMGQHIPGNEKAARIVLDDIRLKQKLGTFTIPTKAKRQKFPDVAWSYFKKHFEDYRDPNTNQPRSHVTLMNTRGVIKGLCVYFEEFYFDVIRGKDVKEYKTHLTEFEDLAHGTFNRRKGVLSSIFSMTEEWVKTEDIEPIKLPPENPCNFVPDLTEDKRERIASTQELSRLKAACFELHDPAMWDLIYEALDTNVRLGDQRRLPALEEKDGMVQIMQGKTGKELWLPALKKPLRASIHVNRRNRWEAVREAAGIPDLQWRDLRKTGLNLVERVGGTLQNMADAAGHSSSKTTEKFYRVSKPDLMLPLVEAKRKLLDSL